MPTQSNDPENMPSSNTELNSTKKLIQVAKLHQLPQGTQLEVQTTKLDLLLCHTDEGIYAIDRLCSHKQLPLTDGKMQGKMIICPHHAGKFDLTTGKNIAVPAYVPINAYQVTIIDETIYIENKYIENKPSKK